MIRRKNKIEIATHFVWATHKRLPLIRADMERALARYISQVCLDDKCTVIALAILPDHVHLLVNLAATINLSNLMMHIKGGSSRFVTQTLNPNGFFGWQNHYGAFSVSPTEMDALLTYIANQKQHHADALFAIFGSKLSRNTRSKMKRITHSLSCAKHTRRNVIARRGLAR